MGEAGRPRRVHCKVCELDIDECGPLSRRGKCSECGIETSEAQQRQLNAHAGKFHRQWQRAVIEAAGGIVPPHLLDDPPHG